VSASCIVLRLSEVVERRRTIASAAIVEDAEREVNNDRIKRLTIDAEFFVDTIPETIEYLRSELISRGYGGQIGATIFLHCEKFENIAPQICQRIEAWNQGHVGPSIFLLDQKGYTDVSFATIRSILRFIAAECILTFAVGWLVDYMSSNTQTLKSVAPL
jgi:three-Cys-motif partner protein